MTYRETPGRNKSRIYIFLLLIFATNIANAQTNYTIKGQVLNEEGNPIISATLLLQNTKDSSILTTEQTSDSGCYRITVSEIYNIYIKVMALGYTSQIKSIPSNTHSPVINFILIAEKSLQEVTVSSHKPVIEEKADRTVFNVENSITAIGGDALDALKKTPGVQVMNTEVTIAGKNSVSIMINGRLQQLSGNDLIQLLRTIPSDNLSKIEVITAPPAKYDAEGNSGIINLVTKRNIKQGFNGSATASYEQNILGSPGISTSVNYRKEKLNLYCNANAGIFAWRYTNRTTSYYPGEMTEQNINQNSFNKSAKIQFGVDYSISKKSVLGVQFTEGINKIDNYEIVSATNYNAGHGIDSVINTNGTTHELYNGKHTLNLNYEWRIDTIGKKLNVDADYYSQVAQKNRDYNVQDYIPGNTPGMGVNNQLIANPAITVKSLKADVEWPLTILNLSFGGKAAVVENRDDNIYKIFEGTGYVVDSAKTNAFSYIEQTQALYISGQKSMGKFEIQVGLRGERTQTDINSQTTGQYKINEYTQLFPSGYAQYKFDDKNVFSINFTRRINRPGYNLLNPFRLYYSPNYYVVGNPDLKPSFIDNLELAYRWRSRLSFKLFAKQVDNYWDHIIQTDATSGTTSLTRANIGFARFLGISVNGQFNIREWWETRNSANVAYSYFNLHYYNRANIFTGTNEWFETGNSFFLNKSKTLSAELEAYYYTPRQKDYKKWAEMSCINIGVKALFFDKNLILALNIEDIMARAYWLQTNLYNGTVAYSYDNSRGGRLSLTYKFGNKNAKVQRERNTSNEEIQRAN